jgi:hypothetical protein
MSIMTNEERDRLIREIHAQMAVVVEAVERHEHTLNGNVRPGLLSRFERVETLQGECRGHARARRATIISICAMVAAVAGPILAKVAEIVFF